MNRISASKSKRALDWVSLAANFVAAAVALTGCGSGGDRHAVPISVEPVVTRTVKTASGVLLTFAQDKKTIRVGQDVTYSVTITNATNTPINYELIDDCSPQVISGIRSSIAFTDIASDKTVSLGGGRCNHIGPTLPRVLAPGASIGGSVTPVDALTQPGTYAVTLTMEDAAPLSTDPTITAPQSVTVGPLIVVVTN